MMMVVVGEGAFNPVVFGTAWRPFFMLVRLTPHMPTHTVRILLQPASDHRTVFAAASHALWCIVLCLRVWRVA